MYVYIHIHIRLCTSRSNSAPRSKPTEQAYDSPFIPLATSYSRLLFRPRKLIKVQLIKITYFSSIGAGWERTVVEGGEGERGSGDVCRVCAPSTFFLRFFFAGARPPAPSPPPTFSRLRSFPSFFCLLQYRASEAGFLAI